MCGLRAVTDLAVKGLSTGHESPTMMNVVLAGVSAFSQPGALFVVIVACVLLLSVRAIRDVVGLDLTRQALLVLDAAIAVLLVTFVILVIVRFATLA